MSAVKFTTTSLTPAADTKFAAELAAGTKGHVLFSGMRATDAEARAATSAVKFLTPANLAGRSAFHANKNGTNQTGNADNAYTQVTFGTEVFDRAGDFASSVFTPPANVPFRVYAQVTWALTNLVLDDAIALRIMKNGSGGTILAQRGGLVPASGSPVLSIEMSDLPNGTDTYEVYAFSNNVANGTWDISGSTFATFFMGWQL